MGFSAMINGEVSGTGSKESRRGLYVSTLQLPKLEFDSNSTQDLVVMINMYHNALHVVFWAISKHGGNS